jgi:dTDP-glucose pyrophosphorylase
MTNSANDKAVILARGLGTRMRRSDDAAGLDARQSAVADSGVKALIPIGRPFLDYILSALADAGYRRVCLVVAPEHDVIRRYYEEESRPRRVSVEYAVQHEPLGTADAVAAAESFAADDPILVLNSDNYYPVDALRQLRDEDGFATALFERESMLTQSNIRADRVRQFALGKIDSRGFLAQIVEKPEGAVLASMARPHWVSMNCWRFGPSIFDACREITPSSRGELEITDAVQYVIDVLGQPIRVARIHSPVLDLTSRQDVATVAEKLASVEVNP